MPTQVTFVPVVPARKRTADFCAISANEEGKGMVVVKKKKLFRCGALTTSHH